MSSADKGSLVILFLANWNLLARIWKRQKHQKASTNSKNLLKSLKKSENDPKFLGHTVFLKIFFDLLDVPSSQGLLGLPIPDQLEGPKESYRSGVAHGFMFFFHFKVKLLHEEAKALAVAHQVFVLHHLVGLGREEGGEGWKR
jgi:hypothetical protein